MSNKKKDSEKNNSYEEELKELYELNCDNNKNDDDELEEKCEDKKTIRIIINTIGEIFVSEIIYYLKLKSLFEKLKEFSESKSNDPIINNHIYKKYYKIITIMIESISKILEGSKQFIYKFSTTYDKDNKLPEYSKYEVTVFVPGYSNKSLLDKEEIERSKNYKLYCERFNYKLISDFDNILMMLKEYLHNDEVYNSYKNIFKYCKIFNEVICKLEPFYKIYDSVLLVTSSPIIIIKRCKNLLLLFKTIKDMSQYTNVIEIKFNNFEDVYNYVEKLKKYQIKNHFDKNNINKNSIKDTNTRISDELKSIPNLEQRITEIYNEIEKNKIELKQIEDEEDEEDIYLSDKKENIKDNIIILEKEKDDQKKK